MFGLYHGGKILGSYLSRGLIGSISWLVSNQQTTKEKLRNQLRDSIAAYRFSTSGSKYHSLGWGDMERKWCYQSREAGQSSRK